MKRYFSHLLMLGTLLTVSTASVALDLVETYELAREQDAQLQIASSQLESSRLALPQATAMMMRHRLDRFFDHVDGIGIVPNTFGRQHFAADAQAIDGVVVQLVAREQRSLVVLVRFGNVDWPGGATPIQDDAMFQ